MAKDPEVDFEVRLFEFIKRFECCKFKPYYCPAGILTIGIGHTKTASLYIGKTITEDKAKELFAYDIASCKEAIKRLVSVRLNDNQRISLLSFIFNLGTGAFQRSTLRKKLNRGEYERIPYELMKWTKAGGKVLPGLVKRRRAEADLFIS